jgi:Ca2+-binding EF-hand superfamily protein
MGHSELKKYKNALYAFDYNHNGYVDLSQINKVFEFLKIDISEEQVKKLMNAAEGKKYLNYTEFIMCCLNLNEIIQIEKLENAFRYFDIDNDGLIDEIDIKKVMLRFGKKILNENDIKKLLKILKKIMKIIIFLKKIFLIFLVIFWTVPKEYQD